MEYIRYSDQTIKWFKTLLDKVKYIGFPDQTIKWFHSYLTNSCFYQTMYFREKVP